MNLEKIVCLSTTPWDFHFTRKQQVMSRLTDSEIVYINPPVTLLARFKDKQAKELSKRYKITASKPMDHVTVYNLPPILPFFNKFRFINRINQRFIIAPFVRKILSLEKMRNPILWSYHPMYCDLVDKISNSGVVYDCIDRHSAYKGMITPAVVDKMEADLAKKCSVTFATANALYQTLKVSNDNTYLIPNGANYELFNKAFQDDTQEAEELKDIPTPRIGFVGALQECIDYSLIEKCLITLPNVSFVFVGNLIAGVNIDNLKAYPNAYFLGSKPQTSLPAYIKGFDVCINPFRESRLSADVSPLKFYEYLATGKSVVTSKQPLQVNDFADVVSIAQDDDEFIALCQKALIYRRNDEQVQLQLKRALECSWDSRVGQMKEIIEGI